MSKKPTPDSPVAKVGGRRSFFIHKDNGGPAYEQGLSPQQLRFIKEYLIDMDYVRAGRRAGLNEGTVRTQCYKWVPSYPIKDVSKLHPVAQAIHQAIMARATGEEIAAGCTPASLLEHLSAMAQSKITDYVSWDENGVYFKSSDELTEAQAAAISSIEVTAVWDRDTQSTILRPKNIKLHEKLPSIKLMMGYFGMDRTSEPTLEDRAKDLALKLREADALIDEATLGVPIGENLQ